MIRNLKALSLALVAVAALSALAASSASAADKFTTTKESAIVTGVSHDNVFKVTNPDVRVECTTSKFIGTLKNNAEEATVFATYNGTKNVVPHTTHCNTSIGTTGTVDMNECDYVLTGATTQKDAGLTDAVIHVVCPAGGEIVITTSLCSITIPGQTPTEGGVTYKNEAGGKVKVTATATGITYTTQGPFCGLGGLPAEANNADYNGTVVVSGFEDKGLVKDVPTEGAAIPIETSGS
jgi:hypothetical protein